MTRPMQRKSITVQLTMLFAGISTTVLLLLGLLIGHAVERHFVEQDMELLNGKLRLTGHLLTKIESLTELDRLHLQLDDSLVGHHGLALVIRTVDERSLFATNDAEFPSALLDRNAITTPPQPVIWRQGSLPRRGIAALLPTRIKDSPPVLVVVAVDIGHHEHFMAAFRQTLWLFVILAAALTAILGWMAVRRSLAPLQAIRRGAADITARRLNTRLPTASVPAELGELTETLNQMLARLEESFQRLSDFSSDLAHELRTPVNNLMTQTQVALTRSRSADDYRDVLTSNAEEYERLARMIADMLFLAQADNGLIVLHRESIDLMTEVRELIDFFDALAEEKSLRLLLIGAAKVSGDRLMLRRALANLLSNAIRHAVPGSDIQVSIVATDDRVALTVKNSGTPVPPQHLLRLFDRFYRVDPSRHHNGEGVGLGLAIVRSIVRAHGGEIAARATADGMCFELALDPS